MTPTSAIPSGKSVCKYYLQGKCAFGSACPKSHIHLPDAATTSQLSTLSVKNIESSKKEHISAHKEPSESSHNSESGSDESQGNTATEDENDTWISSKTDAGNTSWHWEEPDGEYRDKEEGEEGRSEEGRSEEGRSEEGRSEGGRSEGKGKEEKQEATEKRDPCWFYSLDQCKAGDECPYLHQDPQKAKHVEKSTTNERLFGQNATDRQRRPFVATGRKKSNLAISTIAQSPAPAFVSTERNTMSLVQGKDEYEEERRNQVESWSNWQPQSLSPVSKPPVPRGQPSQTDMYQSPPGLSNNLVDTVYSPPAITVSTGTPVYSISPTPAQPQVPVISAYPQVSEGSFHWSLYADPLANKDIAFCKRHAQGLCMQRELCQFRHSLTVEEYTLLFRDQQPNLCTLSREIGTPLVPSTTITTGPSILHPPYVPQSFFVTPTAVNSSVLASAPAAVPVPVSAAVPVPASTPVPAPAAGVAPHAKVCTFYPVGKCRNGDRCPYQHIGPPPTQAASPELSYSDQGWETTTRSSATKSTMQCRYYVQRGFCRQGNSCQFIHDSSSRETLPDNSNPEEPPPQQEEEEEEEEAKDDALDWTKNSDNDAWGSNNNNEIDTSGWNDPPDTSGWDAPPDLSGWDMPDNNNNASTTKSVKSAGSSSSKARVAKGACRQFAQSGKCSRGRMCIFSHDLEPRKASSSSSSNQKWASRGSSDTTHDPSSTPANVKETKARGKKKVKSRSATPVYLDNNNADKNSSDWVATSVEEPASREEKSGAEPEGMMNESLGKGQEPQVEAPVSPSGSATPPELKEESESSSGSEGTNLEEQSGPIQESEIEPEPEPEPIVFEHPRVQKVLMKCEVTFQQDVTPRSIKTLMDTTKLTLYNMPIGVSPIELQERLDRYGKTTEVISVDEAEEDRTIQAEFIDFTSAINAYRNINGELFESRPINASLNSQVPISLNHTHQSPILKITWQKPTLLVWVYYDTITKAKAEAARLDGIIFSKRVIKATFVTLKKTTAKSYPIKLERLCTDVTKSDVEKLCPDASIVIPDKPTYIEDPLESIQRTLSRYGLFGFEMLPETEDFQKLNCTAFVTCKSLPIVDVVVEALDGKPQAFLGSLPLTIRPVHYARYRIIKDHFEAITNELDRLKETTDKKCTIQISQHQYDKNIMWIRSFAPVDVSDSSFSKLNTELAQLVNGSIVMSNDAMPTEVWDNYFESNTSDKIITQLSSTTNTFIHCDQRTKQIRVFGSRIAREEARTRILKLVNKVLSSTHTIPVLRRTLRTLILGGGLAKLQTTIGINKVSLDVIRSCLVVKGSAEDVSYAKGELDALVEVDPIPTAVDPKDVCQVCLREPVEEVKLSCHHKYCTGCLQFVVKQVGSAPFRCIYHHPSSVDDNDAEASQFQCESTVPYILIRSLLVSEEKDILRSSFISHINSHNDEYLFCPSLNCQAVYRRSEPIDMGPNAPSSEPEGTSATPEGRTGKGNTRALDTGGSTTVRCSLCLSDVCTACKLFAHPSLPCGWYQNQSQDGVAMA